MALTPSANDKTRESHAKEIAGSLIRPPILDVEFQKYQTLLDAAETEDTPYTLPDIPPPPSAPSISGQKRGGSRRSDDGIEDTGSSGISTRVPSQPAGQVLGDTAPPST